MRRTWLILGLASCVAGAATAQSVRLPPGFGGMAPPPARRTAPRPTLVISEASRPGDFGGGARLRASPKTLAWAELEVKPGSWSILEHDDRGVLLVRPSDGLDPDRRLRAHVRAEYREPITVAGGVLRSVEGDLLLSCAYGAATPSKMTAYQGQNLSGPSWALPAVHYVDKAMVATGQTAFPILTRSDVFDLCARSDESYASRFGAGWRPLAQEQRVVRAMNGSETMTPDLKMKVAFRIEAEIAQEEDDKHPRWRSAQVSGDLDCGNGVYRLTATAYTRPNLGGDSYKLENARFPAPSNPPKPGDPGGTAPPPPPAFSLLGVMGGGSFFMRPCDIAMARLSEQLALSGTPERRQAEEWVAMNFKLIGWRLPSYIPQGVLFLGEEVTPRPTGERLAQVRQEFVAPFRNDKGEMIASRIDVLDVDCSGRRVRTVGTFEYAHNNAKDLVKEERAYSAPWASLEATPGFLPYFDPVCSQPAKG